LRGWVAQLRQPEIHVEPQVFALLALLVENGERLISRDEIIE
jgi:DNA-binding winged helix-turn-helix (wHTH) protein